MSRIISKSLCNFSRSRCLSQTSVSAAPISQSFSVFQSNWQSRYITRLNYSTTAKPGKAKAASTSTTASRSTETSSTDQQPAKRKRGPKPKYSIPEPFVPRPGRSDDIKPERLEKIPKDWENRPLEPWKKRLYATKEKLNGSAWSPNKKLSPEARRALRAVKALYPDVKASNLANFFGISHEAVRRILKSTWEPHTDEDYQEFLDRWARRGGRILDEWEKIGRISRRPNEATSRRPDYRGNRERDDKGPGR
ncbi:hypothetical protein BZA70DRAFT_308425 [Myxozyma melibiosi]|uniref:Required for respiratory growth protein 9, mitochondrial n=1 Tax=Myxozyma melibiosi TaxID=54550 RepID=A0ABR1FCT7_9ASCO